MMPLSHRLRQTKAWRFYRATTLERAYLRRAAAYHQRLAELGKTYSEEETIREIRERCAPAGRRPGEVRTLLLMPDMAWHGVLASSLEKLGPVTWCRFEGERSWWRGRPGDRAWVEKRAQANLEIKRIAREACAGGGLDWVFCYVSGQILRDTVRYLREELGLPTVMMSLDDKQSWDLGRWGSQDIGQVDIAGEFDLYWTSARACCHWILAEGGRPLYMPEGCDPEQFRPMDVRKDLDLAFVGAAYGFRKAFIERVGKKLARYGYSVACFGPGWRDGGRGVWGEEFVRTLNRAWINLGHGGIGYSENLMNVKTRDFEAPAVGTAAYLTTFNPDLAPSFEIGQEICCYRSDNDLIEQAVALLSDKERLLEIARQGRERCLQEHTWGHRFARILDILGVLDSGIRAPLLSDMPAAVAGKVAH